MYARVYVYEVQYINEENFLTKIDIFTYTLFLSANFFTLSFKVHCIQKFSQIYSEGMKRMYEAVNK